MIDKKRKRKVCRGLRRFMGGVKVLGDDEFYRLGEVIFSVDEEKIGARRVVVAINAVLGNEILGF